jgi:hypothetical protein
MSRRIALSETQIEWLRANHRKHTHVELASTLGCHVDSLKRILARLGLQSFPGAKYQVATTSLIQTWNRPCLDCGCTKQRPRHHYFCKPCRAQRGFNDE